MDKTLVFLSVFLSDGVFRSEQVDRAASRIFSLKFIFKGPFLTLFNFVVMAISVFASFRTYALFSILLTTGIVSHAFYTKRFFYRSVVHLAHSKLAIMSMFNMALMLVIFAWRVVQFIFLGPLRFRERERLHLRARDAIIESCFAMSIFRSEFNLVFVSIVITLLLVKSLHWLAKDRIEFLEEQPLSPRRAHIRLVSLLMFLLCIDSVLIARSVMTTFESNKSMFALFVFEFSILIVELLSDFVRYVFLVVDLSMDGRWDGKNLYSFYNELMSDLCQLTLYILFFIYVQIKYNQFPYHIIRELYMTFVKFQRRFSDFLRYRRVVATMNDLFADATDEQLAEGDQTCIICREEMTSAKVLSCGHMFHARCLQSWLKRQLSCPTCRANIDVNLPTRRNQGANQGEANANPVANAGANPALNFDANGNVNLNVHGNAGANANGNVVPEVNANANLNARPPEAQQLPAAGPADVANPADPARLLNNVNNWWDMLMQPPGVGRPVAPPNQVIGGGRAAPPLMPGIGAPQNLAGNAPPNAFGVGPNAMAHQQLRARRRIAWGYPIHPPYGAVPHWPPMLMGNQQRNQQRNQQGPSGIYPPTHFRGNRNSASGNATGSTSAQSVPPPATSSNEISGSRVTGARGYQRGHGNSVADSSSGQRADVAFNENIPSPSGIGSTGMPLASRRELGAGEDGASGDTGLPPNAVQGSSRGSGGIQEPQNDSLRDGNSVTHTNNSIFLPLERLLSIQEQIEVLRAEVEALVLAATSGDNGAGEIDNVLSMDTDGAETRGTEGELDNADNSRNNGRENEAREERVGGEGAGEDEAARIRRHRIEFLERRQRI